MENQEKLGEATRKLFQAPGKGPGAATPVILEDHEEDALTISAALALRGSALPYAPVLPAEDGGEGNSRDGGQRVSVEFPGMEDLEAGSVTQVPSITAVVTGQGLEPRKIQASLFMSGECEALMSVRYTAELDMGRTELEELLYDAYQAGSIPAFAGWDEAKYEEQALADRMQTLAAGILGEPEEAFRMHLDRHLGTLFLHGMETPLERVLVTRPHGDGTLTITFEPGPAAG